MFEEVSLLSAFISVPLPDVSRAWTSCSAFDTSLLMKAALTRKVVAMMATTIELKDILRNIFMMTVCVLSFFFLAC